MLDPEDLLVILVSTANKGKEVTQVYQACRDHKDHLAQRVIEATEETLGYPE